MTNILFVCTGNTCRSPMAEALLRKLAREAQLDIQVRSAGVAAAAGASISHHARAVLSEYEIDAGEFMSTPLSVRDVAWADLILTMTGGHKQHVIQQHSNAIERVYTLKEFVNMDPQVLADIITLEEKIADWQIRAAMGEKLTDGERLEFIRLQQRIPNLDIADPFGGSLEDYRRSAVEIQQALIKLLESLERQN